MNLKPPVPPHRENTYFIRNSGLEVIYFQWKEKVECYTTRRCVSSPPPPPPPCLPVLYLPCQMHAIPQWSIIQRGLITLNFALHALFISPFCIPSTSPSLVCFFPWEIKSISRKSTKYWPYLYQCVATLQMSRKDLGKEGVRRIFCTKDG